MKVLVIKNGTDIDIICEDGSYAFSWVADGVRRLDCYQERISEKLDSDDGLNELLETSKCYALKDLNIDTTIKFVLKPALNWLVPGENNIEARIEELKDRKLEDLINEFLEFK
jgi:hypothetical protein